MNKQTDKHDQKLYIHTSYARGTIQKNCEVIWPTSSGVWLNYKLFCYISITPKA